MHGRRRYEHGRKEMSIWRKKEEEVTMTCNICKDRKDKEQREAEKDWQAKDLEVEKEIVCSFRRPISEMSEGEVRHWSSQLYKRREGSAFSHTEILLQERECELNRNRLELEWAKEREEMKRGSQRMETGDADKT